MPHYEFEAARYYLEGERYCNGSGLSVMTDDLADAERVFAICQRDRENYALRLTRLDTGEVLKVHGPTVEAAHRTMHRAYRLRYGKAAT